MLRIENKNNLVGESLVVTDAEGNLIVWNVMGVYEYASDGVYQIHLRTNGPQADKLFILTKEEGFKEGNARYKITDRDDSFNAIWVNRSNISNISSMVRTLRRIISHANN
jgi:hypothetical protein